MWVGLTMMRVTLLWVPPRLPESGAPGVLMSRSCAWYMKALPGGMRWLTTAFAITTPLTLKHSSQSLSATPIEAASSLLIQIASPPRKSVSMVRVSE